MNSSATIEQQATGMPMHTAVCIRFFDEALEEELYRGIVTESNGQRFTVQALEIANPPSQIGAELYYHDENHRFVRSQAKLLDSHIAGKHSTFEMMLSGDQGAYAEQRKSYRVSVADQGMNVIVDARRECRALDVSAEGLSVVTPVQLQIGRAVSVNIMFDERRIDGLMTVRTVRKRKDGLFRCGLQAPSKNKDLLNSLQTISMVVQRELLCRLAAIGTPPKCSDQGRTSPVADHRQDTVPDANDAPDKRKPSPKTARRHEPRPQGSTELSQDKCVTLRLPMQEFIDMCLPGALLDEEGRVVVPTGDVMHVNTVAELADKPLYIDRNWLKTVDGDAKTRPQLGDEQRRNIRRKWRMRTQVVLEQEDSTRYLFVETFDLSRGGYSFLTSKDIATGSVVQADISVDGRMYHIRGTVRHCSVQNDHQRLVGIKFDDVVSRELER